MRRCVKRTRRNRITGLSSNCVMKINGLRSPFEELKRKASGNLGNCIKETVMQLRATSALKSASKQSSPLKDGLERLQAERYIEVLVAEVPLLLIAPCYRAPRDLRRPRSVLRQRAFRADKDSTRVATVSVLYPARYRAGTTAAWKCKRADGCADRRKRRTETRANDIQASRRMSELGTRASSV